MKIRELIECLEDLLDDAQVVMYETKEQLLEFALPSKKIEHKLEDITEELLMYLTKIIAYGQKEQVSKLVELLKPFCCLSTHKMVKIISSVFETVSQFCWITEALYIEYKTRAEQTDEQIFNHIFKVLPKVIDAIKQENNVDTILEIIERG